MDQLAHEQKLNLKPTVYESQPEKPNLADELSLLENSIRQSRSRMTDQERKKTASNVEGPQSNAAQQQYRFSSTIINKSSESRSPIGRLNLSSSSSSSDGSRRFSPDKKSSSLANKSPIRLSSTSLTQQGAGIREQLSTDKNKEQAKFFSPIKADKGNESSYDDDFEESIKSNVEPNNNDSDQD